MGFRYAVDVSGMAAYPVSMDMYSFTPVLYGKWKEASTKWRKNMTDRWYEVSLSGGQHSGKR